MPLTKILPGSPLRITASDYNAFIDAAIDYKKRSGSRGQTGERLHNKNTGVVLVKNDSASNVARGEVLGIYGHTLMSQNGTNNVIPDSAVDEFLNRPVLLCDIPDSEHNNKFIVAANSIRGGEFGYGYISGACPAKIRIDGNQNTLLRVYAQSNNTAHLIASDFGASEIIWMEDGDPDPITGEVHEEVFGVIRIGAEETLWTSTFFVHTEATVLDDKVVGWVMDIDGNYDGDPITINKLPTGPMLVSDNVPIMRRHDGAWVSIPARFCLALAE
jgi:hypothetical protein